MCVAKVAKCGSDTHLDPQYSLACCLVVVVYIHLCCCLVVVEDDDINKKKSSFLYTHSVLISVQ